MTMSAILPNNKHTIAYSPMDVYVLRNISDLIYLWRIVAWTTDCNQCNFKCLLAGSSGGQIEKKTNKSDLPCWLTGASLPPTGSYLSGIWWKVSFPNPLAIESFPNPLAIKSLNNSLREAENLSSWRAGEELSRKPHAWEKGWASHQACCHDRRLNRKFFISPDFCRQIPSGAL